MKFTEDYLRNAQGVIMGVLKDMRPELLEYYGNTDHGLKADKTVITELDKKVEVKLKEALAAYDKSTGFLGEEYGQEGNDKDFWLIDPIDGTEQFIRGLPSCRSLLTFISNNEPCMALAYRFVTDDLFVAIKNRGTTKNDQPVKVSNRPLNRSWLDLHVNLQNPRVYAAFKRLEEKLASVIRSREFLDTVEGAVDGYIAWDSTGEVWDYAPRTLLIKEAGGIVTNVDSNTYDYKELNFIATNPVIFEQVHKLLSESA